MGDSVNWGNFGLEVKAARSLLGLTRDALGKATNLAPATITRIEDGEGRGASPSAGRTIQSYLERAGIEFPDGTASISVALRVKPGEVVSQVAATPDSSMPLGLRFMWPR